MKAVIFDLGRVLVHWDPQTVLQALQENSRASMAELQAMWREVIVPFSSGQIDSAGIHRYLIERIGVTGDWERFYAAFCRGLARQEDGLTYARSLQQRPGIEVGIISDTNHVHAHWLHSNLPELARFDAVLLSPEVGLLKPDPAIFSLALERLAVLPDQAIFIDDVEENVNAARALGMAGIVHIGWASTRPAVEAWLANGR